MVQAFKAFLFGHALHTKTSPHATRFWHVAELQEGDVSPALVQTTRRKIVVVETGIADAYAVMTTRDTLSSHNCRESLLGEESQRVRLSLELCILRCITDESALQSVNNSGLDSGMRRLC